MAAITYTKTEFENRIKQYSEKYDSAVSNAKVGSSNSNEPTNHGNPQSGSSKPISSLTQEEWERDYAGYSGV